MEQKLKRSTRKDSSKTQRSEINHRYSTRNKQESPVIERSQKRKFEQEQQQLIEKKAKMESSNKGKQKIQDKTTSADPVAEQGSHYQDEDDEMQLEHHFTDDDEEERSHEDHEEDHEEEDDDEEEDEDEDEEEDEEEEEGEGEGEDDDEDDDEDEDDQEAARIRRTLGLQMQGLFGGMMSSDFGRFKSILASLKNSDDPTMQLIALQELAEILSVSSEENLAGYFSSDSFARELVRIMKGPDDILSQAGGGDMDEDMMLAIAMSEGLSGGNPEVMLLACRCISNLLEAMPTAVSSIVSHGAIRVLVQKLKSIQYIDLAEQALYALEKISTQLPRAVVHEGGLSAALMYFDFFSIHAQRTALRTASNCMRGIDLDSFPQVKEVTPTLMNTINYSDRSVVELTCLCWVRISESYRSNRECFEKVITVDLLRVLNDLLPVPGNSNAVHPATFQDLLRIYRSISKASPQLSFELLKLGMIESLCHILTGTTANQFQHITLDSKWRDSVSIIMKIVVDLLPPLPKDDMFSSRRFKALNNSNSGNDTTDANIDPRVAYCKENPEFMFRLDSILFPIMLDMYASTVNLRVRQLVTHTCVKLLHFSDVDTLSKVLKDVSLSSFLSGILTRQEHPVLLIDALYQTELLIKKMPQIYHFLFEREGVLHEIDLISKLPLVEEEEGAPQKPSEDTTVDESDDTTTEADKQANRNAKDEEDEDESARSEISSSSTRSPSSSQRRLFENNGLQAMMRSHHILQQQQQRYRHHHSSANEKGVGHGSTRKFIIQLAQYFVANYASQQNEQPQRSSLDEISQFAKDLLSAAQNDSASEPTLTKLSAYLRDSSMGISSFELINSGLLNALLTYLTSEALKTPLEQRRQAFEKIFVQQPDIDAEGNNALKKLVVRLQEILSRFEAFEVVTPLESSFNDSLRNPTSMLAKQLRLRLSGIGEDIPESYKQLMVSTHAVATFRVLEDYLLARIGASSILCDMEEDQDEDDDDDDDSEEDDHLIIEREGMDVDEVEEDDDEEDIADTVMGETEAVKKEEEAKEVKEKEQDKDKGESSSSKSSHDKKDGAWKIRFSLNGTTISNDSTVYAAVHQYEANAENRIGRNIWSSSYPITFERIWVSNSEAKEKEESKKSSVVCQLADVVQPKELKEDSTCYQVLSLLRALSPAIAKRANGISALDFVNRKLTAKANRQLEEPLIVASSCLPSWIYWLMSEVPFLFPFEIRYLFIQSTSFGYARLIARWQSLQMRNNTQNGTRNDTSEQQPVLGRMERQKVRIMRTQMLESAVKILDLFGSSPTVLEIEYMGEEGTGMGPTLEFYASTSKEFSKHSLNMWRGSNKAEKGYVNAPNGLFPRTLTKPGSKSAKKVLQLFKTLGQFIAKGLLDFRIIDIPFSSAFFKVALYDTKPSPELLEEIDPQLAKSINMLQSFVEQKRKIYSDNSKTAEQKSADVKKIEVDGAKLEDLCLDFTLPGDAHYELKAGGSEISVTIQNVQEYIDLVQDAIAGSGVSQQIAAFREGFNGLFAIDDLKLLTNTELVSLFGKAAEDWSYDTLANTIRADHGFTMESEPVRYLLEILSEFDELQKREFLQFTTGSPRLPIGGWKALRPIFTVVRKIPEAPLTADDYLPSVMTCANYFKMPAYTSKEVMLERLLTSMKEGQNSFLLS